MNVRPQANSRPLPSIATIAVAVISPTPISYIGRCASVQSSAFSRMHVSNCPVHSSKWWSLLTSCRVSSRGRRRRTASVSRPTACALAQPFVTYPSRVDPLHRTSDLQSLLLNRLACAKLRADPSLRSLALQTLDHWDRVAPASSKRLRDEWRRRLVEFDLDEIEADSEVGQELRQASPLGRLLSQDERLAIIRRCKGTSCSM